MDNAELMAFYMKHAINGYLHCNQPGLDFVTGDRVRWCVATHTRTHTHMHAHTHSLAHTLYTVYTVKTVYKHTHTHTHTYTHTHIHTHTYTHTHTHTHIPTHHRYLMTLGTEVDIHSFTWTGQSVTQYGSRKSALVLQVCIKQFEEKLIILLLAD